MLARTAQPIFGIVVRTPGLVSGRFARAWLLISQVPNLQSGSSQSSFGAC